MRLFRIGDGEDGEVAVHHAQHDAVPVRRALQRAEIVVSRVASQKRFPSASYSCLRSEGTL